MTSNKPERTVDILHIRPDPDPTDPDGIRRLRRLLKWALRAMGLRCTWCAEERQADVQPEAPEPEGNTPF